MLPSRHRVRLQELYAMSSYHDAETLLWLLRVCDEKHPSEWPEEVARLGGPVKGRVQALMKKLDVLRD